MPHKVDDVVIDLSGSGSTTPALPIIQRRDIYHSVGDHEAFFFLNYDVDDYLKEFELHEGLTIAVSDVALSFGTTIKKTLGELKRLSTEFVALSKGEYFFKELRLVVASSEAMGGKGSSLAYFYCANDVEHLLD